MILGSDLDALPESVVIGLGLPERNTAGLAMLVAIVLSTCWRPLPARWA
ncbi:MAG: hypothetical protein ACKO5M_08025 [Vulcanococcus sp.]